MPELAEVETLSQTEPLVRMSAPASIGVPIVILASLAPPELARLEAHLFVRPDTGVLLDWRHWSSSRRTSTIDAVISLVSSIPVTLSGRWAIAIGPTPVDFGIARMLATRVAIYGVRVESFTAIEDALLWLRADSPALTA